MNVSSRIDRIIAEETGRRHAPHCNWCWVCPECKSDFVARIVDSGACRVGAHPGIGPLKDNVAQYIDHTLLKPEATRSQVEKLCQEAAEYHFASVCVNPTWVALCAHLLHGTGVLVCTVVGFPLGANTTEVKVFETQQSAEQGACEIDMVINIGRMKSGEHDFVAQDIHEIVRVAQPAHVKVILENCYLTDEEKIKASLLAREAGAHFVKTSTGFGPSGAKIEDVALMRRVVGEQLGVKAAGGIREYDLAAKMIEAGATRLGASASIAIVEHKKAA
jgi:deoxyribose-phosphate aldolase